MDSLMRVRSCVGWGIEEGQEDLPLELIGRSIARMPVDEFVARVGKVQSARKAKR